MSRRAHKRRLRKGLFPLLMPIRVFLIEDEPVMRELCEAFILSALPDLEIIGEAANGDVAMAEVLRLRPDLCLLDIELPGRNGLSILKQLKLEAPEVRVLLFSGVVNAHTLRMALEYKTDGFVDKAGGVNIIKDAVEALSHGRPYYSPKIARRMLEMQFQGLTVLESE